MVQNISTTSTKVSKEKKPITEASGLQLTGRSFKQRQFGSQETEKQTQHSEDKCTPYKAIVLT